MHLRKLTAFVITILLCLGYLIAGSVSAVNSAGADAADMQGRLIVKFKNGTERSSAEMLLAENGSEIGGSIDALGVQRLKVRPGDEKKKIEELKNNPLVEYAEPDYRLSAMVVPNDPSYTLLQWNLPKIHAPEGWDVTTGAPVVIAVIDTGVSLTHPDLVSKLVSGATFVDGTADPNDDYGHGTHVAGIAAAATNNSTGIAGVSWGAKIMPIKVLDSSGSGDTSDVAEGIIWAADHGARIVNLSLGSTNYSETMLAAINYALARNVVVVAAMGNSALTGNPVMYPAAYPGVIGVAATTISDNRAGFSEYNEHTSVAAPGSTIYSTVPTSGAHYSSGTGYMYLSGTSMATPHVAGLAALILSVHPEYSWALVKAIIEQSADDLWTAGWDQYYGWGRINAYKALTSAFSPRNYLPITRKGYSD